MDPPEVWDATDAARMLLSCILRIDRGEPDNRAGLRFGAGHIMDVVRGKANDKVKQYRHEQLSTFGVGAAYAEDQLRAVLRQLVATGAVGVDAESFNTLYLTEASRAVLKGNVPVRLRELPAGGAKAPRARRNREGKPAPSAAAAALDSAAQARFEALRAWRAEVAKEHNLPAYVIFHDATLAAIAQQAPGSLEALAQVSGVGAAKLEKYGDEVLRAAAEQ
jgi:ATP-dependent DNA helicase RecQ